MKCVVSRLYGLTGVVLPCNHNRHTVALLCIVAGSAGVWAWGNGSGGKLGLGDNKDRYEPCIVPTLRAKAIVQVRVLHSRGGGSGCGPAHRVGCVLYESIYCAHTTACRTCSFTMHNGLFLC
jgi:alpha-tubulin suppressor-like RCC1 family protein